MSPEKNYTIGRIEEKLDALPKLIIEYRKELKGYRAEIEKWKADYVTKLELKSSLQEVQSSMEKMIYLTSEQVTNSLDNRTDGLAGEVEKLKIQLAPVVEDLNNRTEDRRMLRRLILSAIIGSAGLSQIVYFLIQEATK